MTKTVLLISMFMLGPFGLGAKGQTLEWVRFAGVTNFDSGSSITTDPNGNAYVIMRGTSPFTAGTVSAPEVDNSFVIGKYSPNGQVAWVGHARDGAIPEDAKLAWDPSGSLLVAGSFIRTMTWVNPATDSTGSTNVTLESAGGWTPFNLPADIFLLKLDPNGNLLWTTNYGSLENQTCTGMALDSQGNAYLGGMFKQEMKLASIHTTSEGLGGYGLGQWIGKLDTNGHPIWLRTILSSNTVGGNVKIAVDGSDNVFVASTFFIDAILGGGSNLVSRGDMDILLAKYNPAGELQWVRQAGSSGGDAIASLAADHLGNVYFSGAFRPAVGGAPGAWFDDTPSAAGPFLAKYDSQGNLLRVKNEDVSDLKIGPDGNLYGVGLIDISRTFAGKTYTANGYYDIFAAKWDQDGIPLWSAAISDREVDVPSSLALDASGAIWVSGNSVHDQGPSTYGTPVFGRQDALVARFASTGPRFLSHPVNQLVRIGEEVQFEATLTNAESAELQWLKNGQPLAADERFSGASSNRLTIRKVELADEGEYVLRVQATNGSALSAAARLRIEGLMRFKSIESLPGGGFRLDFEGLEGRLYNIEASEDLVHWSYLTNGFARNGLMTVTDRSGSTNQHRLFRAFAN